MADEIRRGFSWASMTALVLGIGIIAWLAFTATKKTDSENYSKGATHNESTTNISPVQNIYPLGFSGCTPFLRLDNPASKASPAQAQKEVRK